MTNFNINKNIYTMGETYRKGFIDVSTELIPKNPAFRTYEGEKLVFEEREGKVSSFRVSQAIEEGVFTDFDKTVLGIIATFGVASVTTKALSEMLTLMGLEFKEKHLEKSLKRLDRYHMIRFSHFVVEGKAPFCTRVITLSLYGSKYARQLGVIHRFNPMETASADAGRMKAKAQTAHLIVNYLKNYKIDCFSVRPVIVIDTDRGAIVRPSASVTVQGTELYFEVVRRREGYIENLRDKLKRYELCFEGKELPTVIINGEDESMNREIAAMVSENGFKLDIMYTEDLLMFGDSFKRSLYDFAADGSKRCYEIAVSSDLECAAEKS